PRYELQKRMIRIWSDSFKDVDLVIFMADVTSFPTDYDLEVLGYLEKLKNPLITVFNKIDRVKEPDFEKIKSQLPPNVLETVAISALNGTNIDGLMAAITKYLPFHEPYYTDDQLSDLPMRFFAQEAIREGIFRQFEEEIPYATAVLIEKYSELPKKVVIDAVIWIERQSQKPIIIGKNGENLQRIREYAERELTHFIGMPVLVHLWVKINPNWRKKNNSLRELGFE
ncbi:MAG: GTPase Era, partial [Candidatus Cloacimonetes bacterium HGW-Cloacimonetes-1]